MPFNQNFICKIYCLEDLDTLYLVKGKVSQRIRGNPFLFLSNQTFTWYVDRKTVDLYRSKDPIVSLFMFCRIIHGYLPNIFFCELYKCDGIIITAPLTSWKGSLLQRHTPVPPLWYRVSWPLFPSSQLHHIDDCFTMTIVHSQRVVKFYNIRLWNLFSV